MTVSNDNNLGPLLPAGGGGPSLSALAALRRETDAAAWRRVSDVAQTCAKYLSCHPAVLAVRYPGLTTDASYREASCTLEGGFGPLVDVCLVRDGAWLRYDAREARGDAREEVLRLERVLGTL